MLAIFNSIKESQYIQQQMYLLLDWEITRLESNSLSPNHSVHSNFRIKN